MIVLAYDHGERDHAALRRAADIVAAQRRGNTRPLTHDFLYKGLLAEYAFVCAVRERLGVPLTMDLDVPLRPDNGIDFVVGGVTIDVKGTASRNERLCLTAQHFPRADVYVLVRLGQRSYDCAVVGWTSGVAVAARDVETSSADGVPFFGVPAAELLPIDSLWDFLAERVAAGLGAEDDLWIDMERLRFELSASRHRRADDALDALDNALAGGGAW